MNQIDYVHIFDKCRLVARSFKHRYTFSLVQETAYMVKFLAQYIYNMFILLRCVHKTLILTSLYFDLDNPHF